MILVGAKMKGKKLFTTALKQYKSQGYVSLAAVSERSALQISTLGQRIANATGIQIEATPTKGEVMIDGVNRLCLVVIMAEKGKVVAE